MKSKDAAEESATKKNFVFNWLDLWNSLPEEVKLLVINKLNMLEVFRLGNVCKDFSGLWKGLRNLDFGEDDMELIGERGFNFGDITSRIVSDSGLKGPIDSFDLYISRADHIWQVREWMKFLSKKHVKSLAIQNPRFRGGNGNPSLSSSDILKCTDLQHLSLKGFKLPPLGKFQGFANLISLKLDNIIITKDMLQSILAKSPLLEDLHLQFKLYQIDGPVVIDSCMLKTFHLKSENWGLCLRGKCSNLTVAFIDADLDIPAELPGNNKLNQFFSLLPNIEILTLTGAALITLARGDVPRIYDNLNACLQNLKQLNIFWLRMDVFECVACAFCIIRSSPNLQSLSLSTIFGAPRHIKEETKILYENQRSVELSSSLLEFNMEMHADYSELLMLKTMLRCCTALETACLTNRLHSRFLESDELSCIERILGYPRPESTVIKFDLSWPDNRHIFNRQAGRFYWKSG